MADVFTFQIMPELRVFAPLSLFLEYHQQFAASCREGGDEAQEAEEAEEQAEYLWPHCLMIVQPH